MSAPPRKPRPAPVRTTISAASAGNRVNFAAPVSLVIALQDKNRA
jgi:hypothetical protein